jgi:sulfopyruvate decarboxylase TPP-binding subunit
MISGPRIAESLVRLGVTDVVWLPDSLLGTWEPAIAAQPALRLVRVCREGEAWVIAAGLHLGGRSPLVVIQCTGLFESGDAMRNVLFDLGLPLFALIGYRSYLLENSSDTAKKFTEPFIHSWGLESVVLKSDEDLSRLEDFQRQCRERGRPGIGLIAEGRG